VAQGDPYEIVMVFNIHRRQLTPEQKFVVQVLLEVALRAGLDQRGAQATIRSGMQR
jgi:hypothetical protein